MLTLYYFACRVLTHYTGEPDEFKGDIPNHKVRDMAKEALDAIFAAVDLNPSTTIAAAPLQVQHGLHAIIRPFQPCTKLCCCQPSHCANDETLR